MDNDNLEFIHDILVKADINELIKELKNKKRPLTKDTKFITMPIYDDGIKHKINIIRTYMNKEGKEVGGRPYFECPTCKMKKRHLFYPYQYIPDENRKWQCYKCTQKDDSIGYVVYDREELAKYIAYKDNGEETAIPFINLFPIQSQYGSREVNSTSYKRVVDRIAMLFRSKGHKLNPDIEEVLRNKVVADSERTKFNIKQSRNGLYVKYIKDELIKVGGKDKDLEILNNLLLYRDAIIDKEIRYYSAIADMAMHERAYSYFEALLKQYIEHYKAITILSKEKKFKKLGTTIPAYFKKICKQDTHIRFTEWDVIPASVIYRAIINKQLSEDKEPEPKPNVPLSKIDIKDLLDL